MLTCVAVVLNVGPFATDPNIDGLRATVRGLAAPSIVEQPNKLNSIPGQEDARISPLHSPSAVEPENISEPVGALIRASSLSAVELASSESRPARPRDEVGD